MAIAKLARDMLPERREALAKLLAGDLEFHSASSAYASHSLHAFAAKFPPQIPRAFVEALTVPGEVVLDPMMGSGTAVLEAGLLGRQAVGVDIDPLAIKIATVKTTPIDEKSASSAAAAVVGRAEANLADVQSLEAERRARYDAGTCEFQDYWFLPSTQHELMALLLSIERVESDDLRELFELVFSSIIVTKSGGVSRARDLAHSRPHRVLQKTPRNAVEQFRVRVPKAVSTLASLGLKAGSVRIYQADARDLPLADCSVDLVITSPPYANAIDYVRAHKFSLVWMGARVDELTRLRASYLGSENCSAVPAGALPASVTEVVEKVSERDPRKGKILVKYLLEMAMVLREIERVLQRGRCAGVVVGPSTMRGITVPTHRLLAEIAAELGLDVVGVAARKLDRDRRMMPFRRDQLSMNGIEQRMHEEFVIGLMKG